MKIRFLRPANSVGFGYQEKEVADLPDAAAKMLIEKGFAELVARPDDVPETRESKAAPETRTTRKRRK